VNGPASTTPIPILITGSLYTRYSLADYVTSTNDISWSTLASVFAASYTDSGQFDSAFVSSGCAASGGQFASDCVAPEFLLPFILHLNILPGNLNVVTLNANTNYQYNVSPSTIGAGAQTSSFQAVVDPVISFDPSFDSSGYSLELSDGIVNAPEPGTIAFTVTGAALMGLRLKSRHTRSSAR
jgi:hypothetical protein